MKQLENELIINCKKINKNRNVFICVCKMAGHIFFVHTLSQERCKTNLVLFFFSYSPVFCMPVYFLIYITMNLFLILITGGLEIFLEKKSLNVSVKL